MGKIDYDGGGSGGGGGGVTDHGALTGLTDDDHTQYLKIDAGASALTEVDPLAGDAIPISDASDSNNGKKILVSSLTEMAGPTPPTTDFGLSALELCSVPGATMGNRATATLVSDRLYYCPFYVPRPLTIIYMQFWLGSTASSQTALEIGFTTATQNWAVDTNMYVNTSTGMDLSSGSNGDWELASLSIDLDPGNHFFAFHWIGGGSPSMNFRQYIMQNHPVQWTASTASHMSFLYENSAGAGAIAAETAWDSVQLHQSGAYMPMGFRWNWR